MEDFVKFMHIICFRFLNEDGLLLVQGSIDEHHYTIGSAILPVLDIKEVSESHKNSHHVLFVPLTDIQGHGCNFRWTLWQ